MSIAIGGGSRVGSADAVGTEGSGVDGSTVGVAAEGVTDGDTSVEPGGAPDELEHDARTAIDIAAIPRILYRTYTLISRHQPGASRLWATTSGTAIDS